MRRFLTQHLPVGLALAGALLSGATSRAAAAPSISGPAQAVYGSTVQLTAVPGDFGPASYQWKHNQLAIAGATLATLTLPRVTAADSGSYEVDLTSTTGSAGAGADATLTVVAGGRPEVRDPSFVPALSAAPDVVVIQPDGKLVVAGPFTPGAQTYSVARLNSDGSTDTSFHPWSPAGTVPLQIVVRADGQIYVRWANLSTTTPAQGGTVRLLANGDVDPSFTYPTTSALADPGALALATDGTVYVQSTRYEGTIVHLLDNGTVDAAFNSIPDAILLGTDNEGRILATTEATNWKLQRFLADGSVDPAYAATTQLYTNPRAQIVGADAYIATDTSTMLVTDTFFHHIFASGAADPAYGGSSPPPPAVFAAVNKVGFDFGWAPKGSLWQITGTGGGVNTANRYRPDGSPDAGTYATLPDQSFYRILAIGADGAMYAVSDWYPNAGGDTFIRIRPITGQPARLSNLSGRGAIGADPLIAGFTTAGANAATVLTRAIGPGLAPFGVGDPVADPQLSVVHAGTSVAHNDNWDGSLAPEFTATGAFPLPSASKDAAVETSVAPGGYSTVATAPGQLGTGLVELYSARLTADSGQFINLSARAHIDSQHPLIAGFSIVGDLPARVLIRAVGPTLAAAPFNLAGTVATPQLTLYHGATPLWAGTTPDATTAAAQVGAFPLTSSSDIRMVVTLAPGSYTAVMTDANHAAGTGLVEVYLLP